jgi:hypothetical protein
MYPIRAVEQALKPRGRPARATAHYATPNPRRHSERAPPYVEAVYDLAHNGGNVIGFDASGDFLFVWDIQGLRELVERNKCFRSSEFPAFIRSMNYHGFKKYRVDEMTQDLQRTAGPHGHVFYHRFFKRGRTDLLSEIKSKTVAPDEAKATAPLEHIAHFAAAATAIRPGRKPVRPVPVPVDSPGTRINRGRAATLDRATTVAHTAVERAAEEKEAAERAAVAVAYMSAPAAPSCGGWSGGIDGGVGRGGASAADLQRAYVEARRMLGQHQAAAVVSAGVVLQLEALIQGQKRRRDDDAGDSDAQSEVSDDALSTGFAEFEGDFDIAADDFFMDSAPADRKSVV